MKGQREAKNSAAERSLAILTVIAVSRKPLRAIEVAAKLRLSRATAHRLMQLLERLGYLQRAEKKHFEPGPSLLALAERVVTRPGA